MFRKIKPALLALMLIGILYSSTANGQPRAIGFTWQDLQHSSSIGQMIVRDNEGGTHFVWTCAFDAQLRRVNAAYNYLFRDNDLLEDPNRPITVHNGARSSSPTISLVPEDGRAIVFYQSPNRNEPNVLRLTIASDWMCGIGAFLPSYLPIWEEAELAWPHGTIDQQNIAHVVSTEITGGGQLWHRVTYSRGITDDEFLEWEWNGQPVEIGVTSVISGVAAASPQSNQVALAWHHNRIGQELGWWHDFQRAYLRNNDIQYIISENGENWDWENGIESMTQIIPPNPELLEEDPIRAWGDTLRPYCDIDIEFDPWEGGDNLYAVFAASGFKEHPLGVEAENPVSFFVNKGHLWFWSSETDEITLIYETWYGNFTDNPAAPNGSNSRTGSWRLNADRGSIVFDPDEPGNIYVVWEWCRPIMSFDAEEEEWVFHENAQDTSEAGFINKEIMISASTDFGRNWHVPVNITETIWDGDEAPESGECLSEDYVSASPLVDDGAIHMMYILDTDAGAAPYGEGQVTNCPVVYHRIEIEDLNIEQLGLVELPRENFNFHNLPEEPEGRDLVINFRAGWNLISINISPPEEMYAEEEDRGPDILLMTEQMRIDEDQHNILVMKNEIGQFYSPTWDFNNIPFWDLTEGYFVCVREETETTWMGVPIQFDADIPMDAGWNIVAFYPTFNLSAQAPDFPVLAPIIDNVRIAKNGLGQFLSTEFEFSNMADWRESQGYLINVLEECIFNYPEDGDLANLRGNGHADPTDVSVSPTDANMSILVTGITDRIVEENDWLIAYNSNGIRVGSGKFNAQGCCGLAAWADDNTTEIVEGLLPDEAFELRLRNASEPVESKLEISIIHKGNGLVYTDNGFLAVEMNAATQVPSEYYLSECYPNPFNNQTRIGFGLPETSNIQLSIFDITGRLVSELVTGKLSAGTHTVNWDARAISAGIYFVRLKVGEFSLSTKVMLMK